MLFDRERNCKICNIENYCRTKPVLNWCKCSPNAMPMQPYAGLMQHQCSANVVPMQYVPIQGQCSNAVLLKNDNASITGTKKGKFWVNDDGKRETPEAVETNQKMPKTEI